MDTWLVSPTAYAVRCPVRQGEGPRRTYWLVSKYREGPSGEHRRGRDAAEAVIAALGAAFPCPSKVNGRRPDPDQLLLASGRRKRAAPTNSKIFFSASAGVLDDGMLWARQLAQQGTDVVIRRQTHGRKETQALVDGFERLPLRDIVHRGMLLREFDIDGALAHQPALILVDELAHSNVAVRATPQALAGRQRTSLGGNRRPLDGECAAPRDAQ